MTTDLDRSLEILNDIYSSISSVIVGKQEMIELLLVTLLSQGHVLIEGPPGTAKTTIARTFAQSIGGCFKRIQGTPDMLPADILGFHMYHPDGSNSFIHGPIFTNVLLADELNRTNPRTQAALLQAMQEQQVTIEGETYSLEHPFFVIASQTPYGGPGTAPLSDVQIDRFMLRIWSSYPTEEEEKQIIQDIDRITEAQVSSVATLEDIVRLQKDVKLIHVSADIIQYITAILNNLRHHKDEVVGPSSRGGIGLFKGARALAFIRGRDYVTPDDVKSLLVPTLSHRLPLSPEAEIDDVTPESIIKQVMTEVPVPKSNALNHFVPANEVLVSLSPTAPLTLDESIGLTQAKDKEAITEPHILVEIPDEEAMIRDDHSNEKATTAELPSATLSEVPADLTELLKKITTDWQWIVVIIAFLIAVIMITFGLLLLFI